MGDDPTRTLIVSASEVQPGQTVAGKYRIVGKLGRGGMGVVYEAEDLRLERTVALKFLPAALTADPEARERFVHEARTASSLDHPNICTIHDVDETEDGGLYIAMACYPGETLKEKIARGSLAPADAIRIAAEVAEGLAKAHEHGIVHRDIKPGNIMVTDGRPGQDPRLRAGQAGRRCASDPARNDRGDGRLHVPRTGPRRRGRCPDRPLVAGRHPLRDGRGNAPVRAGQRAGHSSRHRPRRAAGREGPPARLPGRDRGRHPEGPGQGPGPPLRLGRGNGLRPPQARRGHGRARPPDREKAVLPAAAEARLDRSGRGFARRHRRRHLAPRAARPGLRESRQAHGRRRREPQRRSGLRSGPADGHRGRPPAVALRGRLRQAPDQRDPEDHAEGPRRRRSTRPSATTSARFGGVRAFILPRILSAGDAYELTAIVVDPVKRRHVDASVSPPGAAKRSCSRPSTRSPTSSAPDLASRCAASPKPTGPSVR